MDFSSVGDLYAYQLAQRIAKEELAKQAAALTRFEKKLEPPLAVIKRKISDTGLVRVDFSNVMIVYPEL